jgi:AcrR family transcriptional regulator
MEIKERILATATELFLKEGVKRVTMDELANTMGMSKRTIYEIFSNKDELLKECIEELIKKQRSVSEQINSQAESAIHSFVAFLEIGLENMKDSNPYFATDVQKYYPKVWESTLCANYDYNLNQISTVLHRGVNEGVFLNNIKIPMLSKLLLEQLTLMADTRVFPPNIYPPADLFESLVLSFTRGISSPKGLLILDDILSKRNEIINNN